LLVNLDYRIWAESVTLDAKAIGSVYLIPSGLSVTRGGLKGENEEDDGK
jgi:hypothetical protein